MLKACLISIVCLFTSTCAAGEDFHYAEGNFYYDVFTKDGITRHIFGGLTGDQAKLFDIALDWVAESFEAVEIVVADHHRGRIIGEASKAFPGGLRFRFSFHIEDRALEMATEPLTLAAKADGTADTMMGILGLNLMVALVSQ